MDVAEIMCSCALSILYIYICRNWMLILEIKMFFSKYLMLKKYSSAQTKFEITQKPGAMYEAISCSDEGLSLIERHKCIVTVSHKSYLFYSILIH